ncbi:MAG: hypothetical protein LOY00_03875, partial [Methylocaldum sp.]|nr:hypothetical protein [Methylocaldum sp.]
VTIRVDANQGWIYNDAVCALQGLEAFDIQFCEQPIPSYDDHLLPELCTDFGGMGRLREHVGAWG